MRRFGAVLVGTLGVVAITSGGCSATPSSAQDEDVASVQGAIDVLDWPNLPLCTVCNGAQGAHGPQYRVRPGLPQRHQLGPLAL